MGWFKKFRQMENFFFFRVQKCKIDNKICRCKEIKRGLKLAQSQIIESYKKNYPLKIFIKEVYNSN